MLCEGTLPRASFGGRVPHGRAGAGALPRLPVLGEGGSDGAEPHRVQSRVLIVPCVTRQRVPIDGTGAIRWWGQRRLHNASGSARTRPGLCSPLSAQVFDLPADICAAWQEAGDGWERSDVFLLKAINSFP